MIPVPYSVMNDYVAILRNNEILPTDFEYYKKWLRYFYDFYAKYLDTDDKSEKVRLFLEKLRSKKQTPAQCQQAAHAISLYFQMQNLETQKEGADNELNRQQSPIEPPKQTTSLAASPAPSEQQAPFSQRQSQYSVAGYQEKSTSPEWDEVVAKMADEIKVRHYSRKTLKTYAHWSRQFQRFLKNKQPQELSSVDVKEYLTFLAVKCQVAAATQNQAFCLG